MRFSLRICRFLSSYGSRDAAGLVPVPLGPSFFLYALGDMHIALAHMCVRTSGTCGTTGTILMNQRVVGPSRRPRSHFLLGPHDGNATPAMAVVRERAPSLGP